MTSPVQQNRDSLNHYYTAVGHVSSIGRGRIHTVHFIMF